jgi:serine protease Do
MSNKRAAVAIAACLTGAVALGYAGGQLTPISLSGAAVNAQQNSASPQNSAAQQTQQPPANPTMQRLPDFSALVEQYGPAVVNISTTQRVRAEANAPQPGGAEPDDPLSEFFRRFGVPPPEGGGAGNAPIRQGMGSGFVVSADGYILTNAHVVADATQVTVKLSDKREFAAKVIGADKRTDVGLVKIDAKNLPTVRIGDTGKVKVGEWVAAIGSPFGLENTVTAGIVSAKSRSLPDESYVPFLQTDVAINPGNSGGPLFNMQGEVIGINSQIYSRTGGYMGLSFAIPIDVAMKIKNDLQQYGKVERGRLGITVQPLTKDLAESFGLKEPRGALVASIEPGSPAAKAGFQPGDVIVSVNGKPIEQSTDLPRVVGETKPGSTIGVQVVRQGNTRELRAEVGRVPDEKVARADTAKESAKPQGKLGLAVRPLTSEERKQIGSDSGVLVENVSGPAAKAGIQPGDVILGVNNQPVRTVEQLRQLVDKSQGNVALLVQREDAKIYVPIKVG